MAEIPHGEVEKDSAETSADSPTVITSDRIFQGQREIWIEHDGERYRLRITRRNRLILQK